MAIIKPDAVKAGLVEEIIAKVSSTKINLNDANHPERFFVDGNFESKLHTFLDITSSCCEKCNHRSSAIAGLQVQFLPSVMSDHGAQLRWTPAWAS